MLNKKTIFAIVLISVFVVGLQISNPVSANGTDGIDSGTFKVNGKKVIYYADYEYKNNIKNNNQFFIDLDGVDKKGKDFCKIYLLKKTKKNQVKCYLETYDKKGKTRYKLLKTYTTNKSLDKIYFSNFKQFSIDHLTKSLKK